MVKSADVKILNKNSYSPRVLLGEVYEDVDDVEFIVVMTVSKRGVPSIAFNSSAKAKLHGVYLAECLKQMLTREQVEIFMPRISGG